VLADDEWNTLKSWYAETEAKQHVGEINVPAMCLLQGLISGSGIRRVVQLGHYFGYSTLLLGFLFRSMGVKCGLFSIDIAEDASRFTQTWIARAKLDEYVTIAVGDSAAPSSVTLARNAIGGSPQLVLIDSSHQYSHTLKELDLWTSVLPLGGIVALHDTSNFATAWDSTAQGGVRRALDDWLPLHPNFGALNLNGYVGASMDADSLVYKDGCGLGLLQRIA
jgi:predicted O-methyltransferase YrrM